MKLYNPQTEPFQISGFPFYSRDKIYRRMPLSPCWPLPEAVDGLADETSGGQIRFHARLKKLSIEVSLAAKPLFFENGPASPHMPLVTKAGFDCYVSADDRDYVFAGVAKGYREGERFYRYTFFELEEATEFDILLNFPPYGAVDKILIGLDDEAEISAPHMRYIDDRKIVIYGSSIQQGGCAGRPGLAPANLLSRWSGREVYCLGFNSSGKGEAEVVRTIAQIENPAALVVSIEGNCPTAEWLDEKLRALVPIYREKHPETPIVLLPFAFGGIDVLCPKLGAERRRRREIQERIVADLNRAGDTNVYLLSQDDALEREFEGCSVWHEATVDGLHPNDIGFYWCTKALYVFLKKLI